MRAAEDMSSAADMTLCMTLSGHTSTLPRLVVWSASFQGHFRELAKPSFVPQPGPTLTEGVMILLYIRTDNATPHARNTSVGNPFRSIHSRDDIFAR